MAHRDFIIIGAGVIGCSLARRLAGDGHRVTLIDRSVPGGEASHAAAGMLAPSAEAEAPSPLFQFALYSRALYPALAAELQAETGIDPQYRTEGTLLPYRSPEERDHLYEALAWQATHGAPTRDIPIPQLREVEPAIASSAPAPLLGAYHLPEDHQVDNRRLVQALVRSCLMRGVEMLLGQPVVRVLTRDGTAVGVETGPAAVPRTITGGAVINASGAWAAQVPGEGIAALPIRPVKGHMLALRTSPTTLRHVIRTPDVYLIPRRDGRIIIGSTMEEAGFDKTVNAASLAKLIEAAQRVCPALAIAEWLEAWTGLRPASPDGLPIIGTMPGVANYWTALGHFRNGILLAPGTAELLTSWLLTGKPPRDPALDLAAFSPQRFL